MKYNCLDAKDYAQENFKGIWAACLNPWLGDGSFNEAGFRSNIRHWVDDLSIAGLFIAGKQGEFFSMTLDERKRNIEVAVEECDGRAGTIFSASDQNFETVVELALHAQACGADYVVIHAPVLHFVTDQDEILYKYYKAICDRVDIGIAMWSHPDSGYLMSPQLCARIAELPNIVAIKYSVPRHLYVELTQLAGDKIHVSTADEGAWLDNIEELGWKLYLCSSPPYQIQSTIDQRMNDYTRLAFDGKFAEARMVRDSLDPVREAFKRTKPADKPQAHGKYWQELLGQVGGGVRAPMLDLTETEKTATQEAFESCGLRV